MAGHPDPDVLAGYREGLLGRRRSARIRAHLDRCPSCASVDADLAQVTELLASTPPPTMPGHLAARLENVLAAEVAARAANPDAAGLAAAASGQDDLAGDASPAAPGGTGRRRPDRGRRRTWQLRPATLGVAAAVAAVLAIGGYGLASLHLNAGSNVSAGSAAGTGNPSHGNGVAASPAESGAKGFLPSGAAEAPQRASSLQVIGSGTNYLPGQLASQAQAVLASHPVNAPMEQREPTASQANPSQLQSCVTRITGGLRPVLIDQAQYQGRPATIIIYPATATRAGQVWVVGQRCSATDSDLIAHSQLTAG